jgi:tRNA_anti-like
MVKRIVGIVIVLALIGVSTGIYLWNKPHKKVEDAKSISLSAADLSKEYSANEQAADAKYLNKAIVVTGLVSEIDTNQDGHLMLVLQAADPAAGVQCSMRDKGISASKGNNVTIEGFCSGNSITGVSLTDCVEKK